MQPWEHWKTERGWPLDRRLLQEVSIWNPKITIAELLAAAQEQTKVRLSAHEPELQSQRLTIFAKGLRLNALMFQLSQLLGLFWYQRETGGQLEYIVTYGSSPPELRSAPVVEQRQAEDREERAQRIADFIEALSLSEEELKSRASDDPMLVGSLLRRPDTRAGAQILAHMRPESLRQLIEEGHVLLGTEDMPASVEAGLRKYYREEYVPGESLPRGLSEDEYVKHSRVWISASRRLTPADGIVYDVIGGDWQGFRYGFGILGSPDEERPHIGGTPPEWWPKDLVGYGFLPFLLRENGKPDFHLHEGWLPGKGSTRMVQANFPDLIGETGSRSSFVYKNLEESRKQREERLKDSPWKDDPRLAEKLKSPLGSRTARKKATDLLQAIAKQSGYALLGTYFEDCDPEVLLSIGSSRSWDAPHAFGVRADEPLYMLLNRAAQAAKCSWTLDGTVIRWLHNDWFVLEAKRRQGSQTVN